MTRTFAEQHRAERATAARVMNTTRWQRDPRGLTPRTDMIVSRASALSAEQRARLRAALDAAEPAEPGAAQPRSTGPARNQANRKTARPGHHPGPPPRPRPPYPAAHRTTAPTTELEFTCESLAHQQPTWRPVAATPYGSSTPAAPCWSSA